MDIKKIEAIPKEHRRTVHLTVRVTPHIKKWLIESRYSPTAIFHEAIKDLGYKKQ